MLKGEMIWRKSIKKEIKRCDDTQLLDKLVRDLS